MQGAASVPGRTPGGRARCAIAHPQRWYVGSVAGRTAAGPQQRSFGIAKERAAAMQRASAKVSRRACPGAPPTNPIDLPCGRELGKERMSMSERERKREREQGEGAGERGSEAPRRRGAPRRSFWREARGARREARLAPRAARRGRKRAAWPSRRRRGFKSGVAMSACGGGAARKPVAHMPARSSGPLHLQRGRDCAAERRR